MKKPILILSAFLSCLIVVVSTASAQTFDFNTGTTQNWTLDQMYETSSQKKITPFTSFVLSNQSNQLAASASPILIGDASVTSYDIYLQSPDLFSNLSWQNISGYSIDLKRTLGSPCGNPPKVYFAQLQMKVIDTADGNKEKLFAEYNGTSFVFHTIKIGQQYHFVWKPPFLSNSKYKVKHIRIRLTGPGDPGNGECAPKGSWLLDNVSATTGTAASIIVDVPNGGEVWEAETPRFIRWHSPNFTSPVKIEYSINGGSSYSTIITSTANSGSYQWNVPNTPSTQCRVRISDAATGTPSDESDVNFTIAANEAIFVDVPNGGESWEAETPRYIVWHNHLFSGAVKIEYSTDGGSNYTTITASTVNTGSYQWTVPNTPSAQCRVRISDAADGNPSDASDANFTITATESITLDVPNGGENWVVGSPHIIVWHNHLFSGAVKIEYSTDGGANYSTIVASTPNSGSYTWTIPNTPSANCLVKVSDAADGNPWDVSDSIFEITATTSNNTPSGSNIQVPLGSGVELAFDHVDIAGTTTLNTNTTGPVPPDGFAVLPLGAPIFYDINTTASFSGNVDVCVEYNPQGLTVEQIAELMLRVFDENRGKWLGITTSVDVNADIICGTVSHLSDFAVMTPTGGTVTQTISLPQGWSWMSFNVQPPDLSIEKVMAGATNLKIVVNGAGQFYIPNVINNIGQINLLDGYKVYVDATDQVSVTGQTINASTPINLVSGWNFVAYLPGTPMSAESALASCISSLAIVKNAAGEFFIPNVINSLGNMKPGEGYKLYLHAAATLTYPQGSALAKMVTSTAVTNAMRPVHFKFRARTGESYSVVLRSLKVRGQQPETGDEVGLFTAGGLCVGAGVWDGSSVVGITAWADDARTDELDGYRAGEEMRFMFWDAGEEISLSASFSRGSGKFNDDAFAMVDLQSAAAPISFALAQNYPNPFNAGTMISYQLPVAGSVELKIYNLLGKEVWTLVDKVQEAGLYKIQWDGRDALGNSVPSGVYLYRIKSGSFSAVKKAVFVK